MKFNFSSGVTLPCGQYEPALKFASPMVEHMRFCF
jgi:hypothetical protein